jgi:adenylate cyclase class 2
MGYEIEVKYRSVDHAELRARLHAMGCHADPQIMMEDHYLGHAARDFAQTHEAFRIRRISDDNRITYKGPRLEGPTKTREELELSFESGQSAFDQLTRLFANLGFTPVATIRKERTTYHLSESGHAIEVLLDRAEGLGDFVEIEVLANTEAELPAAQAVVLEVASRFGLTEVEPRSYLRMALEGRGEEHG